MKLAFSLILVATLIPAPTALGGPSVLTAAEVDAFIERAERELSEDAIRSNRIGWINETYITDDTDALVAEAEAESTALSMRLAIEAAPLLATPGVSEASRRKLSFLVGGVGLPGPTRAGATRSLSEISTRLQSRYGKGGGTLDGKPIGGSDIEAEMGTNRDPARLREMWTSWHDTVGAPMRQDYASMVALANEGAKELGFPDVGVIWRSQYDMTPDAFAAMLDRLWSEVGPLYRELHCYTRGKLSERYGEAVQPKTGPIRADLLGNMWAQHWGGIYDIVAPQGSGEIGFDTGALLVEKGYDAEKMVRAAERFFISLGFEALPDTLWDRSMLVEPADREVMCQASAWDIDNKDDLRLKMCIKVNAADFRTVHHELGHLFYFRAYKDLDYLDADGANDAFHEAIGDTIALSVTPDYLAEIGLLDRARVPGEDKDIGLLLRQAMDKVAFLPFGLLVDRWQWGVFDGSIPAAEYNAAWHDLRKAYQGVVPPVERDETSFDPGAKYHVASTTPYSSYFLASLLQFQLYEAACRHAGWKGPLHRCSFYGNKEVGRRLQAMMAMGASRPWPDALEAFTGSREISGRPIAAYFKPLQAWLKEQNKGSRCGW
jgi:peptidyl-dipeptidase A